MNSTNDKVKGTFNRAVGKVKETAGKVLEDSDLEASGTVQKHMGKGQQVVGVLKDKFQKGSNLLGDKLEKVGQKLQEKGHVKTGSAVEKAGDKIEHMAD